ncbi:MAG: transcriptional regulator [Candidatus Omnitrophota bacterium]
MHTKLEMAQDKFIESIGELAGSIGINNFIAQLYAVLYLSDKPLSLDEIVERLKASKGNISLNIRELEKWGAVKKVWVKGSRKDYYEAEPDVKKVAVNKLKNGVEKRMAQVSNMIEEFKGLVHSAENDMTEEDKKIVKAYDQKLKKIEEMKSLVSKALGIAEKFF